MPYRQRGSYRKQRGSMSGLRPINSIKNIIYANGSTSTTPLEVKLAIADDTLLLATNVNNGSRINQIWLSIDVCGTFTSALNNQIIFYIAKNPGDNLTMPSPSSEGTSNEKKFIFWSRQAMVMRIQEGGNVYHWEGWIKIPKHYRRFGTDDTLVFEIRHSIATTVGHFCLQCIYKWYK